jgi:hypothetical protein
MGQIAYRANLSAATYPMTIADGGRTVIMPGPDQNFDRRVDPQGEQKDAGIPQALYLENVMPTVNGYQSVGFLTPTTAAMTIPGGSTHIVQAVEIKATITFAGPSLYPFSIFKTVLFVWNNGSLTAGKFGDNTVTYSGAAPASISKLSIAVIKDKCYLYISAASVGELYEVTSTVGGNITLTNVTAAVTPANFFTTNAIHTICASNNYLIAQNTTTTFWSSTTTSTDFVSSLVSGAGQIDPNNSDDAILYVKESANGFYLYAANTIIFAQYTGNARYPFKFTAVKNATGVYDNGMWGSYGTVTSNGHYVIEKNRYIKFIQGSEASQVAPEVSDYIGKNTVQELFTYATNLFTTETKVTGVATIYAFLDRYICVSVNGTNDSGAADEKYSHVIVFDSVLRRYGRLELDHSFIFTVSLPNETLAFVNKQTKVISFLTFDIYQNSAPFTGLTYQAATGVLVLGKFQYARSRFLQLHEVELEGGQNTAIISSPNLSCVALPSLDGRNFDAPVSLTASTLTGGLAAYPAHLTSQNISLAIKGAFNLSSVQLKFSPRGDR